MFVQNLGTFDYYINSSIIILSGYDGSLLWQMNTPRMQMISVLTIQTEIEKRDLFYFRAQGIESITNSSNKIQQVYHGIEPQQPLDKSPNLLRNSKREEQNEFEMCQRLIQPDKYASLDNANKTDKKFVEIETDKLEAIKENDLCENEENNERYLSTYGFIMDRTTQHRPIVVFKSKPTKIYYNYTESDLTEIDMPVKNATNCIIMEPMERNTGAIGYLSSKNELDIVTVITTGGIVRKPSGEYLKILVNLQAFKKSLKKALQDDYTLDESILKKSIVKTSQTESSDKDTVPIDELKFKSAQSWTAYMGYKSNSWYD